MGTGTKPEAPLPIQPRCVGNEGACLGGSGGRRKPPRLGRGVETARETCQKHLEEPPGAAAHAWPSCCVLGTLVSTPASLGTRSRGKLRGSSTSVCRAAAPHEKASTVSESHTTIAGSDRAGGRRVRVMTEHRARRRGDVGLEPPTVCAAGRPPRSPWKMEPGVAPQSRCKEPVAFHISRQGSEYYW